MKKTVHKLTATKDRFIKQPILKMIRVYQKYISPDTGLLKVYFPFGACRYHPTCSNYTYQAIDKYGIIRGSFMGIKRILRCNPFSKGGIDPVD